MKNEIGRVFTENGKRYSFDYQAFQSYVKKSAKQRRVTQSTLVQTISETINVSKDAVNNWMYGRNGVSSIEFIKDMAKYLQVDWKLFLKELNEEKELFHLSERQKDSAKRIYDILIWFLDEFSNTDGFSIWWTELKDQGNSDPEDTIYERLTRMEECVQLVINQEYFDLHNTEIYDAFCEFAGEELTNLYLGKIGNYCGFDANDENTNSIWQEYETAMQHLNELIERIV